MFLNHLFKTCLHDRLFSVINTVTFGRQLCVLEVSVKSASVCLRFQHLVTFLFSGSMCTFCYLLTVVFSQLSFVTKELQCETVCVNVARYQNDFAGVSCRTLSQRYYYQALALCPELGKQISVQQCTCW